MSEGNWFQQALERAQGVMPKEPGEECDPQKEKVIGVLQDPFTLSLRVVLDELLGQLKALEREVADGRLMVDVAIHRLAAIKAKTDVVSALFWSCVTDEFDPNDQHHEVGVRNGWQVVAVEEEEEGCGNGCVLMMEIRELVHPSRPEAQNTPQGTGLLDRVLQAARAQRPN